MNSTFINHYSYLYNDSSTTDYLQTWNFSSNIWKIIIVFVSVFVCLLTQAGNVLVLLSFRLNKKLRVTNNYFLLSLAIADLIIGVYSMPVFTLYVIADEWLLGRYFCDLWLCLDYAVSNASVGSLLLISFDRYFSITRPLSYRANRTTKKVVILIALSWFISVIMWSPFIIGWPYFHGGRLIKDNECKVQFLQSSQYLTLITAFVAFYLPVTIICILYFQIWRVTKRRQLELRKLQCQKYSTRIKTDSKKFLSDCGSQTLVDPQAEYTKKDKKSIFVRVFNLSRFNKSSEEKKVDSSENFKYKISYKNKNSEESDIKDESEINQQKMLLLDDLSSGAKSLDGNKKSNNRIMNSNHSGEKSKKKKNNEKKADQKAAKTLSALLLAFLITWLPYNLNVVMNSFCGLCLDKYPYWQSFAYWLCYTNSTINPVLYAMCNANFRKTFKDILTCRKINQSI